MAGESDIPNIDHEDHMGDVPEKQTQDLVDNAMVTVGSFLPAPNSFYMSLFIYSLYRLHSLGVFL